MSGAMPEATTLYSVTGVVIVGLVVWVSMVLKQAKEPWSRPAPPVVEAPAEELDKPEVAKVDDKEEKSEEKAEDSATPKLDADDTARATPVALSEGRQKAADEAADDKPADEEKEKKSDA